MSTSELLQNKINKSKSKPPGLELDLDKLNSASEFEKNFYELFRFAFITNCHLDEASVTGEELDTLEELSTEEVFENFKDLVNDLLNFKKDYKGSDKAELAQRSEQFENMLQKLEAEVRNHIRIEHQLKLHIESNQQKIEELERYKLETDEKIQGFEGKNKGDNQRKAQVELSKDKIVQKFEVECTKLKSLLEDKVKECEKLKKELEVLRVIKNPEKNSASIETLKKKMEEKAGDLNKIHHLLKEKEKPPIRPIDRKKKKSLDENSRNSPSPFRTKKENESTLSESRPSTAKKTPSRSHVRSNSDQTRAITSKKMII
jgi:hypothetical protein